MSFLVTVHERRVGIGQLGWITLGLGPANVEDKGTSLPLMKERLVRTLKAWVKKAKPRELARIERLPGLELERHRVTLEVKRMTATVNVPLVLEPRHAGPERITIGYHPLHQDDFFVVAPDAPRAEQYRVFLEHLMRDAGDVEDLVDLEVRKDRLRTIVFDADPPSLLERVGPRKGAWWSDLQSEAEKKRDEEEGPRSELDAIATDLTERASENALPIGLPREPIGTRLRMLAARAPVVLIGRPGVGKTTLLQRWVHERLHEDGYALHKSLDSVRRAWALAGRRVLAGMKHHGDWEARMARLVDELKRRRGTLVVPDITQWARLGRTRDSERNLADVMRGPLERREVSVLGEATREAWARLEEEAPAFAAQFQTLQVDEPHHDELVRMLLAGVRKLEDGEHVFEPAAIRGVREWSEVLYPSRAEPARSLALLEEASHVDTYVSEYEMMDAVTERAGVPNDQLSHRADATNYEPWTFHSLRDHVVGQPEPSGAMVDMLQRIRMGLADPSRPWGVFLFTGPTGTGKTELAKGVARYLYGSDQRLLRIDMNQLNGPDAAAQLIGDGFEPNGRLTAPILDAPFQVVLLDELEKAHPSVLYLLLQLLDEGRLTDAAGRTADFRRAVILITSNLGAAPRPPLGFGDAPDASARKSDTTRAVAAALPPELFNRLDGVLAFQPLDRAVARSIAERQVARLAERAGLRDRHGTLVCAPAALDLIVAKGFDPTYGARTVKRWIESYVTDPIAAALVAVPGDHFKRVRVDVDPAAPDTIVIAVDALAAKGQSHSLPYAWLLDFAPADCDQAIDALDRRLAAIHPRPPKDARDERRLVTLADSDEADRYYWREQLKARIAGTLKALRRMRNIRKSPVRDIVLELSRGAFLARVAPRVEDDVHRATVRLSRPTASNMRRLMIAMAVAYRDTWEIEEVVLAYGAHLVPLTAAQATARLAQDGANADRIVLRLSGVGARLALASEVGSHVLDSMAFGLEVVALELVDDARPLRELALEAPHGAGTLAGAAASSAALPDHVRTIRHELPQKEAKPYVVIDHRTGYEERGHIVDLAQLVAWCATLAASADPLADTRAAGAPTPDARTPDAAEGSRA